MAQVGYGPNARVNGPSPQAPKYGLLKAANVVDDVTAEEVERWINGVSVYPYPTALAHPFDSCAPSSTKVDKSTKTTVVPTPNFGAFALFLTDACNPASFFGAGMTQEQAQARFTDRAVAAFTAVESAAIEREFLAGDIMATNPHLADAHATFPYGVVATTVVNGIATLEDAIAATGKRGMLHLSPGIVTIAANNRLIEDVGGVLQTVNGNVVVSGTGYSQLYGTKSAPSGKSVPTFLQEWIYATGMVDLRRSEIEIVPGTLAQAMNRGTNLVEYMVERYYVIDWDTTLQAAVLVDRCSTSCGTPPS